MDKLRIKIGIECGIEEVVDDAVADGGFVDVAGFGVRDVESLIRRMTIYFCNQPLMEKLDIYH